MLKLMGEKIFTIFLKNCVYLNLCYFYSKKPSLEVVLWQPPADVVKDVLSRRTENEDKDRQQSQEINNQYVLQ